MTPHEANELLEHFMSFGRAASPETSAASAVLKLPCHVKKLWGVELWLVNNDRYCAKYLYLKPGFQCSLHRHLVKDETFFVLNGRCALEFADKVRYLERGDSQRILAGVWHRFSNEKDAPLCQILEVSTSHSDTDVERRESSKALP